MEITIKRSRRKSVSIEITRDADVIVRAPLKMKTAEIEKLVKEKSAWIEKSLAKVRQNANTADSLPPFNVRDLEKMKKQAGEIIPARVRFYAEKIGVDYGKITIRCQKTRWGSCSSAGNLNFNCLLVLTPPEVLDSIVVHELCHRKQMNHSPLFYSEVLRVFPEYRKWEKWLKENGPILLRRVENNER